MRPVDALPPPTWAAGDRTELVPSMSFSKKIDLVQDAATDCSVVASLCAGVTRAERGHSKILRNVIHPYDADNGRPMMSKNGKYIVRLNFNGCYRRVVIDDRLPVTNVSQIIHVMDRNNPGLLWPALVEKAYLKVRGGYDFPGSNSATDLWILTGWIPEQVFLQSEDLDAARLWRRMSNSFNYGDVLITMGTGMMTPKTERELGLAGEHDYAILDVRMVNGHRLMLIKNPWCDGTSWRGRYQEHCSEPDSEAGDSVPSNMNDSGGSVRSSRDLLNSKEELSPGTFWMDFDTVIQHFESIYLNWNPALFAHRLDKHFAWDLTEDDGPSKARDTHASLRNHPQFTVRASEGGSIWILLCRHLKNAIPASATEEDIEAGRHGIDLNGHVALMAFLSQGRRVLMAEKHIEKAVFVDSPQILLKLDDCEPATPYTIVPLEQDLMAIEQTFTLSVFSNSPVVLGDATERYPHTTTMTAAWTKDTAGGNAQSLAYATNPQFSLIVPHRCAISLLLEAANLELNVHVRLLYSRGQRLHSVRKRDIIFDSKDYCRGCCVAESAVIEAGQYIVICSTYEPQQLGDFTLVVGSTHPTRLALLPREGAGRLKVDIDKVVFEGGQSKVAAPLSIRRLVDCHAVARACTGARTSTSSPKHSMVLLSIELGRGDGRQVLTISSEGEYADSAAGIRTSDVDLSPEMHRSGDLWLVVERMSTSPEAHEETLNVELYVDSPESIVCGAWRSFED